MNNYCQNCGSLLPDTATSCPECNAPVGTPQFKPIVKRPLITSGTSIIIYLVDLYYSYLLHFGCRQSCKHGLVKSIYIFG